MLAYAACIEHGNADVNRLHVVLARSSAVALAAAHEAPVDALGEFEKALAEWEDIGNELYQWWVLQNLAIVLTRAGAWTDAARLAGAVLANLDRFPAFVREEEGIRRAIEELGRRSEEHTSELQSRQYLVCRL